MRFPEFFTDDDGQRCARIPLARYGNDDDGQRCTRIPLARYGNCAILYAEDLEELARRGYLLRMQVSYNRGHAVGYVHLRDPRNNGVNHVVARLILGAPPRTVVRYRDGNRLNLRRSNLLLRRGGSAKADGAANATDAAA